MDTLKAFPIMPNINSLFQFHQTRSIMYYVLFKTSIIEKTGFESFGMSCLFLIDVGAGHRVMSSPVLGALHDRPVKMCCVTTRHLGKLSSGRCVSRCVKHITDSFSL